MGAFFADVIAGRRRGPVARLCAALFAVLSVFYRMAVGLRRFAYRRGLLRVRRAPIPVISVGNVTWGGTGKTPLTGYLAKGLLARGTLPAVVSRGYGEPARSGMRPHAGKSDETVVHAEKLPGVPVGANPNRIQGGREAAARGAKGALLDDGLQHLPLARDLEIITIDSTNPFGNGRLLPGGILRESPKVLRLADVVVLTRTDQIEPGPLAALKSRVRKLAPRAALVTSRHRPEGLSGYLVANERPLEELQGLPVAIFSGIGNPEAFGRTVRGLGAAVVSERRFPDHHVFSDEEMAGVGRATETAGAKMVLTTEKDAVKIRRDPRWSVPLYVLKVSMEILEGEAELWRAVCRAAGLPEEEAENPPAGEPVKAPDEAPG